MPIFRHRISGPGSAGDIWICTMHSNSAQPIASVHSAWNNFVTSLFATTLGPLWSVETKATEITTDQLDPATGKNVLQKRSTIDFKGTDTGNALSPRTSIVIGLRTDTPTRAGRGRMFAPACSETFLTTEGLLSTTAATTVAGGAAAAISAMAAVSVPVIYHRALKTSTPITNVTVGQVLGDQRRRTNKVPANYQGAPV